MNILFLQCGSKQKQDAFQESLRECYSLGEALERLGHTCAYFGPRLNESGTDLNRNWDVIIITEQYEMYWIDSVLDKLATPQTIILSWIIDGHIIQQKPLDRYHALMDRAHIVLHSTSFFIPMAQKRHPDAMHIWFPNSISNSILNVAQTEPPPIKQYDLGFCGTIDSHPTRKHFLEEIKKRIPSLVIQQASGIDMVRFIQSCKVHFNLSVSLDINYRNFETLAAGTCLLTNCVPDMDRLGFVNKTNCLFYDSIDILVQQMEWALTDDHYQSIGKTGQSFFQDTQTFFHRINHSQILHKLFSSPSKNFP